MVNSHQSKSAITEITGTEYMKVRFACVISVLLASAPLLEVQVHAASSTARYRVVDVGDLEQTSNGIVRALNFNGDLVGASAGLGTGTRAFVLTKERYENLDGLPGADWSSSHGINDQGVVVGSSNTPTSLRGFMWTRGSPPRELTALPGDSSSEAFGVNKHNEVVGYSSGPGGIEAVLWTADGKIQGLGKLLDGDYSRGNAVNERSEVVGSSGDANRKRAFIWSKSDGLQDLGTLPGNGHSEAFAINSRSEVVGYSGVLGRTRAFRWTRNTGMQDLGTLPGGNYSRALSINDRGEVVGSSDSSVGSRAFLWTASRGMQDLNTLIAVGTDFVLFEAVSVNDRGMILALGSDDDGHAHDHGDHESPARVFILVPEP